MKCKWIITCALFILLIRTAVSYAQPDSLWAYAYSAGRSEYCYAAIINSEDQLVVAGNVQPGYERYDGIFIMVLNQDGELEWQRTYYVDGHPMGCESILQLQDGGYALGGSMNIDTVRFKDAMIMRLSSDGDWIDTSFHDLGNNENCYSLLRSGDGGFFLTGISTSNRPTRRWFAARVDGDGEEIWSREYGTRFSMGATNALDGGYVIVGDDYAGDWTDATMVKLDDDGEVEWSRSYGNERYESFESVIRTSDGGYIAVGHYIYPATVPAYIYVVKTDSLGEMEWEDYYGGNYVDYGYSIIEVDGGGYLIGGTSWSYGCGASEMYALRINQRGGSLWHRTIGGPEGEDCQVVLQTEDLGFLMCGGTTSFAREGTDVFIAKLASENEAAPNYNRKMPSNLQLQIETYPNPFNQSVNINIASLAAEDLTLQIVDQTGRTVSMRKITTIKGKNILAWNAGNLPSGYYFGYISNADQSSVLKLHLLR